MKLVNNLLARQYLKFNITLIMQAVFFRYQTKTSHSNCDRTDNKLISRKQNVTNTNGKFKKSRVDESEHYPKRDKRYHSSSNMKFIKNANTLEATQGNQQINETQSQKQKVSHHKNKKAESKPDRQEEKDYVFNKFNKKRRQQIYKRLQNIKDELNKDNKDNKNLTQNINLIEQYISKLQQNNAKLLEVNYFFQKEFNDLAVAKQMNKKTEKCNKNYCTECRYHLQKQNSWLNQKLRLTNQVKHLKDQIQSLQTMNNSHCLQSNIYQSQSVIRQELKESTIINHQNLREQVLQLKNIIQGKNEEYLVLLQEFNYLDSVNKDITKKMKDTLEQYRYLSIQNRTLLHTKTKVIEKELECNKIKDQRDYFKKKIVDYRKEMDKEKEKVERSVGKKVNTEKGKFLKQKSSIQMSRYNDLLDESLLTLSSMSNQNQKSFI